MKIEIGDGFFLTSDANQFVLRKYVYEVDEATGKKIKKMKPVIDKKTKEPTGEFCEATETIGFYPDLLRCLENITNRVAMGSGATTMRELIDELKATRHMLKMAVEGK